MRIIAISIFIAGLSLNVPSPDRADPEPVARTVTITATDNMRFSLSTFSAKPGELIRLVLRAVGTQPADLMSHNFVLLKSTADVPRFIMTASMARQEGYLPQSHRGDVLAATDLVSAGQTSSVTFTAPARIGEYPYVCSFPGHYNAGMRGAIIVRR